MSKPGHLIMRILLAEDDANFARMLMGELRDEETDLDWVTNGVDAVLRTDSGRYDAILLDLHMPRMDGLSALSIIHALHPETAVITFSGVAGREELQESIRQGALAFLQKPFRVGELKALLDGLQA